MSEIKLVAESRTEFGKGAARRTRRNNQIPAVLYGHGADPIHVALPGHQTALALKHANALFSIVVGDEAHMAIVKDVQRDPIGTVIEHIDLLVVKTGELVDVDVAVHIVGESAPGTIHVVEAQTLSIQAEATHLPSSIEVSIEGLEAGAIIFAGDIALPEGSVLVTDPHADVVVISEPRQEAEAAPADAPAAATTEA